MKLNVVKIRAEREAQGKTQLEVADAISPFVNRRVMSVDISNLENDRRHSPGFVFVCAVARVLSLDPKELLIIDEVA